MRNEGTEQFGHREDGGDHGAEGQRGQEDVLSRRKLAVRTVMPVPDAGIHALEIPPERRGYDKKRDELPPTPAPERRAASRLDERVNGEDEAEPEREE